MGGNDDVYRCIKFGFVVGGVSYLLDLAGFKSMWQHNHFQMLTWFRKKIVIII